MQTPSTIKEVKDAFGPAFEEISRRRSALTSNDGCEMTTHFDKSDDATHLPFDIPNQHYVLLSVGTKVLAPCPVDPSFPAIRVYGAFDTKEEAKEHSLVVKELDSSCSLVMVERNTWFLLPQTEAVRDDAEVCRRRRDDIIQRYRTSQEVQAAQFDGRIQEGSECAPVKIVPIGGEAERELDEAEALVYKRPTRIRVGAEVRGQRAVALCVIPHCEGECVIKVLGCFESTCDADNWVQNVASRHVVEDDISTTLTCEWFYPNGNGEKSSKTHYRVSELQRIMDHAEEQPEKVRTYKEWKRQEDQKESSAKLLQDFKDSATTDFGSAEDGSNHGSSGTSPVGRAGARHPSHNRVKTP